MPSVNCITDMYKMQFGTDRFETEALSRTLLFHVNVRDVSRDGQNVPDHDERAWVAARQQGPTFLLASILSR